MERYPASFLKNVEELKNFVAKQKDKPNKKERYPIFLMTNDEELKNFVIKPSYKIKMD